MNICFYFLLLFSSVVKFRRTGESSRSEDGHAVNDHGVQMDTSQTDMDPISLAEGNSVPREFANPTDGTTQIKSLSGTDKTNMTFNAILTLCRYIRL